MIPTMRSKQDTTNIWKQPSHDEQYWHDYLTARPEYSQAFYQDIYDYHSRHSGQTATAHDIATGPGQVATELSKRFDHVVASDINDSHLEIAALRLSASIESKQSSLEQVSAEAVSDQQRLSSTDMITAAECISLLDTDKALDSFSRILRPGGTLAAWFYGPPFFAEFEHAKQCQAKLSEIFELCFQTILQDCPPQRKAGWKRATDCLTSFLDNVAFPAHVWQDVERK